MVADANVRGDSAMGEERKKKRKKKRKKEEKTENRKKGIFSPLVLKLCCFDLGI